MGIVQQFICRGVVKKRVGLFLKILWSRVRCKKTASKNMIPSESYEFLKIWVAIKLLL